MRDPHLKSFVAQDTPSATATDDAGHIPVLNDDGLLDSAFLDPTLEALAGLDTTTGLIAQTGTDTFTKRTLTEPADGFTITNPAGVAGNPTFVLADDLAGLEGLASTGMAARTATSTWTTRTHTGTANEITVADGSGVSGNPTYSLPAALTFTGKTVTGGTFIGDSYAIADSGTETSWTLTDEGAGLWSARFDLDVGSSDPSLTFFADATTSSFRLAVGASILNGTSAGALTWDSQTVWTAGNDGTGSGLDADLLDGKNTGTSGNVVPLLDGANTHSGTNVFQKDTNANHVTDFKNVDTGTASAAVVRTTSDSATASLISHAAARTVTRYGQVLGDWNEILSFTGSGLAIGTNGNVPFIMGANNTEVLRLTGARLDMNLPLQLKNYTVAALPAGTQGDTAFVTDALAPTFLTAVVGGGAVVTPVFYDGTNWVAY